MEHLSNDKDKKPIDNDFFEPKSAQIIKDFYDCYLNAIDPSQRKKGKHLLEQWLELVMRQITSPAVFEIYHEAVRAPFDYYRFGLDFVQPLINFAESKFLGKEYLKSIDEQLARKENVILLANHQTEPDPQIISLLLQNEHPQLAEKMIFVAGHRVISDPLAVPMSLGRNLLCIYSKKHINHPSEDKSRKIAHNQRTLKKLQELLSEGGQCIYVAPSGGRDRTNATGIPKVAPFDPVSLELFLLIAKQSRCPTHFYPLALKTFALMPPPQNVEKELGEIRQVAFTPVYLAFGQEIDLDHFPDEEGLDKQNKRIARANYVYNLVKQSYDLF